MSEYEEHRDVSPFWSWAILVAFCGCIVGWGLLNFLLVKDAPRQWDFRVIPEAPSESIYTTVPPPVTAAPPRQFPALPEAIPHDKTAAPATRPAVPPARPAVPAPDPAAATTGPAAPATQGGRR